MPQIKRSQTTRFLSISIGLVYLWFGGLKYFSGFSPAEQLAQDTIAVLTFDLIPPNYSILLLALWESLVGISLLIKSSRTTLQLALLHILLTFTPVFFFPERCFVELPFKFTLLGQYIFKNIIILATLLQLYRLSKKNSYGYQSMER